MSAPAGERSAKRHLSPRKSEEIAGIGLALAAALAAASLGSYHPGDPSLLSLSEAAAGRARNWIGPFGAQLAALAYGVLGLAALLIPLLLGAAAVRRLRRRPRERVVGRGAGAALALATLPGLLHLALPEIAWRGETLATGGAAGHVLADVLTAGIGTTGALLVLLGGAVSGCTLLIQSSLGDVLAEGRRRFGEGLERLRLGRARRRERREKERARERVLDKQLRRVMEERGSGAGATAPAPLRVRERWGPKAFLMRRVRGRPPADAEAPQAAAAPLPTAGPGGRPAAPEVVRPVIGAAGAALPAGRRGAVAAAAPGVQPAAAPQLALPVALDGGDELPPLNLLSLESVRTSVEENELVRLGEAIRGRCAEFGVDGTIAAINPGPVITVFEFQPAPGVKVSQIVNLQDDLALALKAESVRIDRIPGRSTLGIEVPNRHRAVIRLGHLLAQEAFRRSPSLLTMAIGMTVHGQPYYADLAGMPHVLVAGATGSGKSVGLQAMITSILYKARREEVQFIFIDPKRIELGVYGDIPHLKAEVVVEPKKAANALRWAVAEMERRYRLLAEVHVRSIEYYNRAIRDPEVQRRLALGEEDAAASLADLQPLPYYVIVIDELADLMMTAGAEVEAAIARLAQMARAVGIHLIVATQRPSVDILTGTIKANFPCRIAFATATRHDSRTILDQVGSEKLLGRGDMLFMPPGTSRLLRLHGAYVTEQETAALVRWLKKRGQPQLDPEVLRPAEEGRSEGGASEEDDEMFGDAARLVVAEGQASASFLQRRLRIGFSRAARLIDLMERDGLLGPPQGSKPREVLVKPDFFAEWEEARKGEA